MTNEDLFRRGVRITARTKVLVSVTSSPTFDWFEAYTPVEYFMYKVFHCYYKNGFSTDIWLHFTDLTPREYVAHVIKEEGDTILLGKPIPVEESPEEVIIEVSIFNKDILEAIALLIGVVLTKFEEYDCDIFKGIRIVYNNEEDLRYYLELYGFSEYMDMPIDIRKISILESVEPDVHQFAYARRNKFTKSLVLVAVPSPWYLPAEAEVSVEAIEHEEKYFNDIINSILDTVEIFFNRISPSVFLKIKCINPIEFLRK